MSNEIPLVKYPAKGERNKDLLFRVTRNCVCYARLWLRQNNLPFENITIDESRVIDLPVHREIVIKIHPTDNSKSTAYDIAPNNETNDENKSFFPN